jgi:hypothetical protein
VLALVRDGLQIADATERDGRANSQLADTAQRAIAAKT